MAETCAARHFVFSFGRLLDGKGLTWRDDEYEYTSTLKRLTISPLSLSYQFTVTKPNSDRAIPGVGPLEVVLKDGSTVPVSGSPSYGETGYLVFDVPLDLTQVGYTIGFQLR